MAIVFIPRRLAEVTGAPSRSEVEGSTVRQLIENLERAYPGIREQLVEEDRLKPHISVAVDGIVCPLGLLERTGSASEVHFVAAISGGLACAPDQKLI
ncbi:MAG: MoaD/ThiS family protein [Bryobacteraceae bacterium]|jgi:molybdopterin converting factor small subunit